MKIYFVAVNGADFEGGSELLWTGAVQRLHAQGHQIGCSVRHIANRMPCTLHEKWGRAGIKVSYYDNFKSLAQKVNRRYFGSRSRLQPVLKFQPDLVVISQGGSWDGLKWASDCAELGLPFVSISQAVRPQDWPSDETAEEIIRTFSRARNNFFVSHGNAILFNRLIGHTLSPVSIVFNPCKVAGSQSLGWPQKSEPLRLACVARLEPLHKGQDLIIEVMTQPKWRARDLVISFFGNGTSHRILARWVQELGLGEKILFRGAEPDTTKIWADHHGLILPSRSEGFALALMEAMLLGRMAITSDIADNARVIQSGVNGYIFSPDSAAALDTALEAAWSKRESWEEMGKSAARSIRNYLPDDVIGYFLKELLACVPTKAGTPVLRQEA